jgi:hypothetical protein
VIDHHVDRLDVDAQQCVKLTSTNRSIGLISHIACSDKQAAKLPAHLAASLTRASLDPITRDRDPASARAKARAAFFFDDLVVIARGNTPDPIPNSAVKTLSADGTPS